VSKASIRIDSDPVVEIEMEDEQTESYYLAQHIATIAERVIRALVAAEERAGETSA
jgi:hypothetical protein